MPKHPSLLACNLLIPVVMFATAIIFASCTSATSSSPAAADASYLIAQPDTVRLLPGDSVITTSLKLSCGCAFSLQVTSVAGDTTAISFTPADSLSPFLSQHTMTFRYSPARAALSTYAVTLQLQAQKRTTTGTLTYVLPMRAVAGQ